MTGNWRCSPTAHCRPEDSPVALYAIGDIQGCYDELRRLLDQIQFDPERDRLWFVGDLVNRGPNSLEVLRFVKGLGERAVTVLGNHDLHLLALSQRVDRNQDRGHTLDSVLTAPDRDELLEWLRRRPLMHYSKKHDFSLIHAGLPPQWDIATALRHAQEVEQALQDERFPEFCRQMYGNRPERWNPFLRGMSRLRFITNCFTRLRFCDAKGNLALKEKGAPGNQPPTLMPWFVVPNRASRYDRILFGHWSTLGYQSNHNAWSLDTGCIWGGQLTALKLRKTKPPKPYHLACPNARKPDDYEDDDPE
jgi:bis(5'-nucleosyl)-tetraphosphatase (symmetrical)